MISDKIFKPAVLVLLALLLLMSTCSKTNKLVKAETEMVKEIPTREEVDLMIQIHSLKIERSTLHNMNNIVLTKSRPDFRIEEINKEIDRLNHKVKK